MDYRKMIAVVIRSWLDEEGSGGPALPDKRLSDEENAELGRINDEVYEAFKIERDRRDEAYRLHIEKAIAENAAKIEEGTLGWKRKG
jgi:hypothetical protein